MFSKISIATIAAIAGKPELTRPPGGSPGPGRTYPSRPPDPNARPRGKPEAPGPRDSADFKRSLQRQSESAGKLARGRAIFRADCHASSTS